MTTKIVMTPEEMQEQYNMLEKWREGSFFRYEAKSGKEGFTELGMDGWGRLSIFIDGKFRQAYSQAMAAIIDYNNL